jgi:hypothetical protein
VAKSPDMTQDKAEPSFEFSFFFGLQKALSSFIAWFSEKTLPSAHGHAKRESKIIQTRARRKKKKEEKKKEKSTASHSPERHYTEADLPNTLLRVKFRLPNRI